MDWSTIMWTRRLVFCVALSTMTVTTGNTRAQSTGGAQHFNRDALSAFASTANLSITIFADHSETPSGSSGFAVANIFDLTTGQFTQCSSGSFDLTANNGRAALSFAPAGGFNCSIAQEISVSCEPTSQSSIFHNVITGTAKIPAFEQQYTTHGRTDVYNNLRCVVNGFGVELVAQGSASKEQTTATP
jgi:hypothetical protein